MTAYRGSVPELPVFMRDLPTDPRGFVVPWFTPWDSREGRWRFDAASYERIPMALRQRLCWICGKELFRNLAFTIGPMCAVNRITCEPPSHCACASYAVRVCPFLSRPRMRRVPKSEDAVSPAGKLIPRNPGVVLVWVTRSYAPFRVGNGLLIRVGKPVRVEAWSEGREATEAELVESIRTGLPALLDEAPGDEDKRALKRCLGEAWRPLGLAGTPEELWQGVLAERASAGLPEALAALS
jgi:hypothetical protein